MAVNLMQLLPLYFRPVIEFKEIMQADEKVLEDLEYRINQIWNNFYIQTADEETLKIYENWFSIVASPIEALEYRRQRILQKYNTIVPFSIGFLRNRLTEMFGEDYTLSIDPEACVLTISVTSSRYGAVDLLYDLLWDVVPSHLEIIANQQVTNHVAASEYTAGWMSHTFIQDI